MQISMDPAQPGGDTTMFWVVQAVIGDGWRCRGVFSVEAEADALVASLNERPEIFGSACRVRMSDEVLADQIFEDRLGRLAPLLKLIEGLQQAVIAANEQG